MEALDNTFDKRHKARSMHALFLFEYSMTGLSISILIFCSFYRLVSSVDVTCPPEGENLGCQCSETFGNFKVKCENIDQIEEIPSWIPNDTKELEFIKCNIGFLNRDSFKNLVNLHRVTIQQSKRPLTFNDSLVFQGLPRLLEVNFDDNDIVSLPVGLFANLPQLGTVSLNRNPLPGLPDDLLENSTNVMYFNLVKTELARDIIAKIGRGHFGKNIQDLQLSGTVIERLIDGFSGLPKLNNLGITSSGVKSIGADILKGTNVGSIALDGNPISVIDENAFRDSKVGTFECKGCQLTSSVTFNGFLKKMTNLYTIRLRNNQLTRIPKDAFTGLSLLDVIDLSNNSISTIEENPYADLPNCDHTTCIQLRENPLNCDCHLAWLRSFADNIEDVNNNKPSWKCAEPESVAGQILVSLNISQFCCETVTSTKQCGSPNNGWMVSGHILFAVVSQIVVIFGIPILFA